MDGNAVEYIKLGASLISPVVLFFIQPIKRIIHNVFMNFFNLPPMKKFEAIEYLFSLKHTKNTLECFKQEQNLLGFGFHGDTLLSKLTIKFYLYDRQRNKGFAKAVFSTKGFFRFEGERLVIKKYPIIFILIFYSVSPVLLYLAFKAYDPKLSLWFLIPSAFLTLTAFLYAWMATLLVKHYFYLYTRLNDFNEFSPNHIISSIRSSNSALRDRKTKY